MKINETCEACLLKKHLNRYPENTPEEKVKAYKAEILEAIEKNKELSAPEVVVEIDKIYWKYFNQKDDYTEEKKHFNALMLTLEDYMTNESENASDPLERAIQYAMTGNFIDFGAMKEVDENKLRRFISNLDNTKVNKTTLEELRREIKSSKNMVYLTDNCGEIVTDKVLIKIMKKINPDMHVSAIVRGEPVFNDATVEDAIQVGLDSVADAVLGNGSDVAGTVITKVSKEALDALHKADFIIAKGQGNYESLGDCGLNVYYIFMCKCSRFVDKLGVPLYSGVITRELE